MRLVAMVCLVGILFWLGGNLTLRAQNPTLLPPPPDGETRLATIGMNGEPSNGYSTVADISSDGRWVLVQTSATNLAPDMNPYTKDNFVVRDMVEQTNWLVPSLDPSGNQRLRFAALADDGQQFFIEVWSPDIPASSKLYLYDRPTAQFEQIRANNGQLPNGVVEAVDFSADGRYALFYSEATNIVAGDTNLVGDLFLYDTTLRQSVIVSKAGDGTLANAATRDGSIGADGRYVVFASPASNLVNGDSNNAADIFRHDTMTGETVRVSVRSGGAQLYTPSRQPSVSRDGRYISFITDATDCELPAAPQPPVICLRDMVEDETRRISRRADGSDPASEYYSYPSSHVAADGTYVIISVWGESNLLPEDRNNVGDVYQYATETGALVRLSVGDDERESYGSGGKASADGQIIAFATDAANLGTYDPNYATDVYWRRQSTTPPPTPTATPTRMANTLFLPVANGDRALQDYPILEAFHADTGNNSMVSLSEDGNEVLFLTNQALVPGDEGDGMDAYIWYRDTGVYGLASISNTGADVIGVYYATLSTNGRYVLFSTPTGLDHNDTNGYSDLYRRDLETNIVRWVSYGSEGGTLYPAGLSADGDKVALSLSLNGLDTIYLRDLRNGATTPIVKENGNPFTYTHEVVLSADGDTVFVADYSGYSPLCYFALELDLYRGVTDTGRAIPILQSSSTLAIVNATMSGDGQTIAYRYVRPEGEGLRMGMRLRHLDGSEVTITEHPIGFNSPCYLTTPTLSYDGRWLAFESYDLSGQLPDYLPDSNITFDMYLYDQQRDFLRRVSVPTGVEGLGQSNGESFRPAISANGRVVGFFSRANNLAPNTPSGLNSSHLFVWGR